MTMREDERRGGIFAAIRGRLGAGGGAPARIAAVAQRLAGQAPHLIPERAKKPAEGLRTLFAEQLTAVGATVLDAASPDAVPGVVAGYLRGRNLPLAVRTGADRWLAGLAWSAEPSLAVSHGRALPTDEVGLTHAVAAVAESGTLLLASGPDNPVTLNFLPETSIVVVEAAHLAGAYEEAFAAVRARLGRGTMPRTLNLISGPSRTADVGGRLVTGAHGPRRLCVIVVDAAKQA